MQVKQCPSEVVSVKEEIIIIIIEVLSQLCWLCEKRQRGPYSLWLVQHPASFCNLHKTTTLYHFVIYKSFYIGMITKPEAQRIIDFNLIILFWFYSCSIHTKV